MQSGDETQLKSRFTEALKKQGQFVLLNTRREKLAHSPVRTIASAILRRIIYALVNLKILHDTIWAKAFWGEKILMPTRYAYPILEKGFFEGEEARLTAFILKTVKPGDVFIDGGAFVGWYTLIASKLVGSGGSVHSFEPTPRNFRILAENTKRLANVFINKEALWDKNEGVEFHDFGEKLDVSNTVLEDKTRVDCYDVLFTKNKEYKSIKTEAISLDSYCARLEIKPTFIKLDCEGAEYEIILGSKEILRYRPILAIEILRHSEQGGMRPRLIETMRQLSYSPYVINDDFSLKPLDPKLSREVLNAIFLPDSMKLSEFQPDKPSAE